MNDFHNQIGEGALFLFFVMGKIVQCLSFFYQRWNKFYSVFFFFQWKWQKSYIAFFSFIGDGKNSSVLFFLLLEMGKIRQCSFFFYLEMGKILHCLFFFQWRWEKFCSFFYVDRKNAEEMLFLYRGLKKIYNVFFSFIVYERIIFFLWLEMALKIGMAFLIQCVILV